VRLAVVVMRVRDLGQDLDAKTRWLIISPGNQA
jgi:hypothetical protein